MNESQFLPTYRQDLAVRSRLWELFQHAEAEAKQFVEHPSDWYEIKEVQDIPDGRNAGWFWDDQRREAIIKIAPKWDDLGVIFHEIFHSAFHNSLLHGKVGGTPEPHDDPWGEAFCEAFRYFMEKRLLPNPPSPWVVEMENLFRMTFDEVMASKSGQQQRLYKRYRYPGSLIMRGASMNYDSFKELWFSLLSRKVTRTGVPTLDGYFHYNLRAGEPIV